MNKHHTGYRVSWYDDDRKQNQKYFFGPHALGDAKLFKEYMDVRYPSRRTQHIVRKKSSRNKSGIVGVFRDSKTYCKNGNNYSSPNWSVSILVDPDGKKCRKVIRYYDRQEGSSEAAFQKARKCRELYNQCIENGNISSFYNVY